MTYMREVRQRWDVFILENILSTKYKLQTFVSLGVKLISEVHPYKSIYISSIGQLVS